MNHRPKTFPDQDQLPSRNLLQYTAVLGLPLDVPIAPVETHSCVGRTSGPSARTFAPRFPLDPTSRW